jgi:hypothetical protein
MKDRAKEFGQGRRLGSGVVRHAVTGAVRLIPEALRVARVIDHATPPADMAQAPTAPARATMQLVANIEVTRGGISQQAGAHWRTASALTVMNAQAARRAVDRDLPCAVPFTAAQIAVADEYRALVEWRAGSGIKCASIEAGRGGGGSSDFLDRFIDKGRALAAIDAGIGRGNALDIRRHMDRGNARRNITDRVLVQMVVLQDRDLTAVLVRHGWVAKGSTRTALRGALCCVLDRMQRARDGGCRH